MEAHAPISDAPAVRECALDVPVEETERALDNQSIRQFTEAADIAALTVFLAGPHARTISGQMLPIDGDSKAAQ